jgi:hypothetical protein
LHYENGDLYNGKNIDIYMYQFTKDTNTDYLLENDTFSPVYGYV